MIRLFLREQLFPGFDEPDEGVNLDICPWISPFTQVSIYYSATAIFYAPSELSGPFGMHSEIIRCSPN